MRAMVLCGFGAAWLRLGFRWARLSGSGMGFGFLWLIAAGPGAGFGFRVPILSGSGQNRLRGAASGGSNSSTAAQQGAAPDRLQLRSFLATLPAAGELGRWAAAPNIS